MYCRNCGKEVAEKAEICLNCGVNPMNGANYCSHCGNAVSPNAEICIKCGVRLSGVSIVGATSLHYAGFWLRFVASFIDGLILFIPILILNALFSYSGWFVGSIASWLYYALMESSDKQATLGKQAMKICVTDMQGNGISFGQATGRHFAKIVSAIILYIGFIMAEFTERKQALHDIIANCLVVKKT